MTMAAVVPMARRELAAGPGRGRRGRLLGGLAGYQVHSARPWGLHTGLGVTDTG